MSKHKRRFSAGEKVSILRRHLLDKIPVSEVCRENELQPTVFYRWQKQFFENGSAAFEPKPGKKTVAREQRVIVALERKLQTKDSVLAELMEEHVALKKSLGGI